MESESDGLPLLLQGIPVVLLDMVVVAFTIVRSAATRATIISFSQARDQRQLDKGRSDKQIAKCMEIQAQASRMWKRSRQVEATGA